jgi:hypothetical protein
MFDLTIVADDTAFKYELATEKVDRIHWMMGQDYLLLGTPGGASRFGASSTTDPLTQTNVNAKKQTTLEVKIVTRSLSVMPSCTSPGEEKVCGKYTSRGTVPTPTEDTRLPTLRFLQSI